MSFIIFLNLRYNEKKLYLFDYYILVIGIKKNTYIHTIYYNLLSEFLDMGEFLDRTVVDMEELAADSLALPRPRLAGLVGV